MTDKFTKEQLARSIQLLNTIGQRPQQGGEPLGPGFIIHFIMLCHGNLEGAASPSFKFMCLLPINIMQGRTRRENSRFAPIGATRLYFYPTPSTKGANQRREKEGR